ncbi:MAG: permease [bacterium]
MHLLSDYITYNILQLGKNTVLANTVNFFIYDTIKIFLLLIIITHLMSLIRHYLPITKFKQFLISKKLYGLDYFVSALFGAVTPFCSCSSIPLFIGFLQANIPLGVVFTFLITSPLINEIAVTLFFSYFGWKITLSYIIAGMSIGMIGGYIIGKLEMEKYVIKLEEKKCCCKKGKPVVDKAILKITKEAFGIIRNIWLYIIIGVLLGAVIHNYIPVGFFEEYLQKAGILAVPLAVILAVPMYSNASAVVPVIQALVAKGIPFGTAFAFMMAVVGLSLPEAIMLKKVLKLKLLLWFFALVTVGIVAIGFIFNYIF